MVCWIEGGAVNFLFSVLARRRRRATGPIAAGTWRRRPSAGFTMSSSLSRFSGWRSRSLSLGEGLTHSTGARMAPALMVCWIEGGAVFFLLAFWRGGAVELPGRSRPAPGVVDLRRGGSMSRSLSRFSGWRSRSLSLGEGLTDSTGARDGTRADGVLDRGRRRKQ